MRTGGAGGAGGSVSGLTLEAGCGGNSLRTFRYLWRAATCSLTLRSSSSDDSRRVSNNCIGFDRFSLRRRRVSAVACIPYRTRPVQLVFCMLHPFSSRSASTDSVGARTADRKLTFWITLRFFASDVFLTDNARRSCLLGLNLLI